MLQYIIKRLLLLPLLLLVFSIFAFFIIQAPPGDFVTAYIAELSTSGSSIDRAQIDALRQLYGLDQPIYIQYLKWMGRILRGDLGVSLDWMRPNTELIGERLDLRLRDIEVATDATDVKDLIGNPTVLKTPASINFSPSSVISRDAYPQSCKPGSIPSILISLSSTGFTKARNSGTIRIIKQNNASFIQRFTNGIGCVIKFIFTRFGSVVNQDLN